MKCPSCGYNTFESSENCSKCGASLKSVVIKRGNKVSGDVPENTEDIGLFQEDEPILLDEEIEDYSFHGNVSPNAGEPPSENYLELASFTRRLFAFFLDVVLILLVPAPTILIGLIAVGIGPQEGIKQLLYIIIPVYVILTILASTCLLFLHAYSGKSIGKLIFNIRVIKEDGERIYFNDAFKRWIGYYLSAIPLFYGYISALFDYNLQTWHDKITNTYVIKDG